MSLSVVTAITDRWESALVTTVERGTDARVARRCPDLADLLAVAGSGLAEVALVSADLRLLDRTALDHLAECSVTVVGIYPPGDEPAQRHLLQLGIVTNIPADASAEVIQEALDGLAAASARPGSSGQPVRGPTWFPQGLGVADSDGPDGLTTPALHSGARSDGAAAGDTGGGADEDVPGVIIAVWGPAGMFVTIPS